MNQWISGALDAGSLFMKSEGSNEAMAGALQNSQNIQAEKSFESAQLRQQADTSEGVGEITSAEALRQSRIVQSRTLAVAAAGGGGVSDPSMVNLLARDAGAGTYRSNVALYGGEEKARFMRMQAQADDYEGAAAIQAGDLKAQAYATQNAGSMLAGAGSLFSKFNTGGLFSGGGAAGAAGSAGASDAAMTALEIAV